MLKDHVLCVVCLIGSTKFKKEYEALQLALGKKGYVVLGVGCYQHTDNITLTEDEKELFDMVHMEKIRLADEVVLISVDGYIGESTRRELRYAKLLNKLIKVHEHYI